MFEELICITGFFPPGGHQKCYVTRPGALANVQNVIAVSRCRLQGLTKIKKNIKEC